MSHTTPLRMSILQTVTVLVTCIGLLCMCAVSASLAAPIEITYMSWYGGTTAEIEQRIIDAFNAQNPDIRLTKIGGDPR